MVDIIDTFGEGFDWIVVSFNGKDGLLVEVVNLLENVEGHVATGKDKIEFGAQCLFEVILLVIGDDEDFGRECDHGLFFN